ncbi:MAG: hypothetical protein LBT39_10115, partial [Treponema sp.]|nr:hypothetical protein [Treponema sp.]
VIGSAVNLAQRMESNATVGGILVTSTVRHKAPPSFIFAEKRLITVKGYEEKIEGYDLDWERSGLR